jgi:hypothetical protein
MKYFITLALLLVFSASLYMSLYGLTVVFVGMTAIILIMGAGLEIGKILSIIHLHKSWSQMNHFSRAFYIAVIGTLTILTSCEVLGFLSQRYAGSTREVAAIEARLSELNQEAEILKDHIAVIDQTLAGLPVGYVSKRFRERETAGYDRMRDRLLEIVRKTFELKASKIANGAYSAPIFAASRIFGLNPEKTISVFVIILVVVLESLSIGLAVAASRTWQPSGNPGRQAAETAIKMADVTIETAKEPANAAHPYTVELRAIAERHNLKIKEIAKITDRKQSETVSGWLEGKPIVPIKALRLLRRWAVRHPDRPGR